MVTRIPRYIKIKREILNAIQKGKILNNGRLFSEEELAKIYNVSRTTIRSALQALETEGVIVKKHGSGNFVIMHGKYPNWNSVFTIESFDVNAIPIFKKHQIGNINLSEYVAQKLNMAPGTEALEIRKLMQRKGEDSIRMIEVFPMQFLKKIPGEEEIPDSIFDFTEQFCGIVVKEIRSDILAIPASESPFKGLKKAVLKLEDVFLNNNGQPFAYSDFYMNIENVRPHIIRNNPPFSWKVV